MDTNVIGQKIREARIAKGMTQSSLGAKIGYSAMAISHFEKGTRPIRQNELQRIFEILNLNSNETMRITASTTLFRASNIRGGASIKDRSLDAFDKFIQQKYGNLT